MKEKLENVQSIIGVIKLHGILKTQFQIKSLKFIDDRIEPISRYIDTLLLIPSLDGFNGLMAIIRDTYEMEPYSNSLFLFCGRRCDRIKALHFEKDGFCLLYKRLDNGRFQWPRNSSQVRNLTRQEYRWLLEGLSIDQPKAIRPVKKKDF